jgi:leucyl aminopeptidase (aminopeptidase T)
MRGVETLVRVNGRVSPGERVVVVSDLYLERYARLVAAVAQKEGAEVVRCEIAPRQKDGQEPPSPAAAAMRAADVIFSPVRFSITHTRAMREALDAGARAILMTAYTDDILRSPALLDTDFEAQSAVCRRIGAVLGAGDALRLTSPRGTDLRFSIRGRKANILTNVPEAGELAPVPDIEVNVVPLTGTAEGRLVADASIPYLGIGLLTEPVVCTVEGGSVIKIEGGDQALVLAEELQSHGDPLCYNVAELGIGLNPNARLTGEMLEDEGVLGTIHIGIGTSHTLGGEVMAPTHYDLLMSDPTIEVDGTVIQRGAEIFV